MGIDKDKSLSAAAELRRFAEKKLSANTSEPHSSRTKEEVKRLVHELEVHVIELEMQNAELRQARDEIESSRNKYAELYYFAPVGYFTFDRHGLIREVNLTGAQMLGFERQLLVNTPFSSHIADKEEKEIFFNHLTLVVQRQVLLKCEIRLTRNDGTMFHGQLRSVSVNNDTIAEFILTSIIDVTVRKQLEETLQKAHDKLELAVHERTGELTRANVQLMEEIDEHKRAKESLQSTLAELKLLKERLRAENTYLQQEVAQEHNFGEIIGQSNALSYVFFRIEQVAPQNATVLLLGEHGPGK